MHYLATCLINRTATLLYIVSMTECTNHRPWDTETPFHKISHDEYYEKRGTNDKTKHMLEHSRTCRGAGGFFGFFGEIMIFRAAI